MIDANTFDLDAIKKNFITTWGEVSTQWGVPKTMGQIHCFLLVSNKPQGYDEIMETLDISRGNVHINITSLLEWEIIYKVSNQGDRKDYFIAEKDMWKVLTRVVKQRKKRELDPMLDLINEYKVIPIKDKETEEFVNTINSISLFTNRAEVLLDKISRSEGNWMLNSFFKMP
jgi:DNA-binding transcriptional regulator GbsR (MarR family)